MSSTSKPTASKSSSRDAKAKATSAARNPISLRLYKVLGTNYDDKATLEALHALSDFYRPPDPLQSKGKEANITGADDESILDSPLSRILAKSEGGQSSGVAALARKNLRRDVEFKVSQGSQAFLQAFREVDNKLDVLQGQVEAMRVQCDAAHAQLQSTNQDCKSLLERAGGLRALRQNVADRQSVIDAFLSHFTLTKDEMDAIQSRDVTVGPEFFRAMRKAEKIRADCRVLMAGEEGPTKAGLEIMAMTSQQLEQGYDKAARWCSLEFRRLGRDAQLEVGPLMREAIRWLRKRPELLSEVLAVLSQTRQATLLSTFMDALTRGGPGGLPRPIEIHAHDPMRYIGDMLAWVHQAIAGEREFLEGLFDIKGDGRMVGSVRQFQGGEEEEWMKELMDNTFEKLCTPLKVRVKQTVRSQESCIASYNVANLLHFYTLTMSRTVGEKAVLSQTLNETTSIAFQAFYDTVEAQARNLARTALPNDQDVQPPLAILDHTQVLRELLSAYKSSLLGDETPDEMRAGFQSVLDPMIDVAVSMCANASNTRVSYRPTWDRNIFMLNCLTHLQNVIMSYSFAEYKVQSLQREIDERVDQFIDDHYEHIMKESHLDECAAVCESKRPDEPVSRVGAMRPPQLEQALRYFSNWLSSPEVVQPSRLASLIDPKIGDRVHRAALLRVARAYEVVCTEVRRPENKYEAANTTLGSQRPFGQMTALYQILGLEDDAGGVA